MNQNTYKAYHFASCSGKRNENQDNDYFTLGGIHHSNHSKWFLSNKYGNV